MSKIITHPNWRWATTLVSIIAVLMSVYFISSSSGKPRRISSGNEPELRTPTRVLAPNAAMFSAPIQLVRPLSPVFFQQGGEPEIKVDLYGNIYVTAMQGVPGGIDLWKSVDNGATFTYLGEPDGAQDHCPSLPQCFGAGGGDDQIDVSTGGYLYVSSLWLGNVTVSTSYDGGMGGVLPGQKWEVNPAAAGIPSDDRQWVAAYGPQTLYMAYANTALTSPPGGIGLFIVKSTDAGKTFGPPVEITAVTPLDTVNVQGNLVVDPYNGNIYTSYIPNAATNEIRLARSSDGGTTWVITTAYTGPAGTTNRGVFPILAVDRGGNLHLAFSQVDALNHAHVFLTSTSNPAAANPTWLPAVQVDSGTGNSTTNIMPWIVAGSPGIVDVAWLGTAAQSPDVPSNWFVHFSQTTNAMSGSPIFNQTQVTANAVHNHSVCFNGLGCTGDPDGDIGNRDMLEYFTMALDPEGKAHIAFPDSITNCPSSNCQTNAWYSKQTGGTSAYAPPAPPAPATFAANIPVGSPGAEPSLWVDSFNCVYVTAPGNPWVWKSIDAGASFLAPTNPVSDEPTLTGGDEDIISLPKQDGSHTRPDQLYFTDLGLSSCHIRKSTSVVSPADQNPVWFKPGPGGAAGDVSVSSDRQWLAGDQGVIAAGDQIVYHWEHELASEAMRISSLVNDTAWQFTSGMTNPELVALLSSTFPNTNPGPIFVNKTSHRVFALFNGSVPSNNAANPPFGKLLNVWEMDAAPPLNAATPVTDVQNHPVFKGTYDSPNNPPPAVGPPVGPNFGTNNANIFPAGDIDSAGNIYVAWSMNNSRTNEFSIWFASSHDNGKTFYGPFPVSSGSLAADETAVFPWVAAGDNGRVDIIWYGTTAVGDPNTLTGNPPWHLYFAQSHNANSREPVFTVVKPNPNNVIHNGQISTGGLIGSSDRSLLDFMEVAIGPDGLAHIIFADNAGQATRAEYTKQNGGPIARTNPSGIQCVAGAPIPIKVVSQKTHGTLGTFDVILPLTPHGIEDRRGQPGTDQHKVIFTFPVPVTISGASITTGNGSVNSSTVSGNTVTVNLTAAPGPQKLLIKLTAVNDGAGNAGDISWPMDILLADVNGSRQVDSGDVLLLQKQNGQSLPPTGAADFRRDTNLNGTVDSGDVLNGQKNNPSVLPP